MEKRPYFLFGDLITTTGTGALAGLVCAAVVGEGWNPAAAMVLGMALGMVVAFVTSTLLGLLFGACEIMIPAMLAGMASGMAVAMRDSGAGLSAAAGARLGAELGLAVLVFTYIMNAFLGGEVKREAGRWTS